RARLALVHAPRQRFAVGPPAADDLLPQPQTAFLDRPLAHARLVTEHLDFLGEVHWIVATGAQAGGGPAFRDRVPDQCGVLAELLERGDRPLLAAREDVEGRHGVEAVPLVAVPDFVERVSRMADGASLQAGASFEQALHARRLRAAQSIAHDV